MTNAIIIGIDAGTSVIKSVAFTTEGEQLAVAARPNSYETLANGGVEQDMPRTWADTAATLRELTTRIPDLASRVVAISVTGQGDGLWLLDKAGEAVAPAWLWLDARTAAIVEDYTTGPDYDAHYKRTGTGVNMAQQSVQLGWMARHRPEVLQRAATAMRCKDWLYFNLTGVRATDPSEANFTWGDYRTREYQTDILKSLHAENTQRLLPPIVDGTVESHALSAAAAAATGLRAGTPVCLGFVDVLCTGLGGGLFDASGKTGCTIVGSTGMHMRLQPDPAHVRLNVERSGYTMVFPTPGAVAQIQSNMASTLNIDWLLDMGRGLLASQGVERSRSDLLKGLDDGVFAAKPAQVLYHPYISLAGERGPFMEPAARASFIGLDVSSTYFDMMRAVFEGLAFAARDCYLAMGGVPDEVRITGGAARSKALRLILASVLNAPVRTVEREEAGAAGVAMIAAVQRKIFTSMEACVDVWVAPHMGAATQPNPDLAARYGKAFETYQSVRKDLRPHWSNMKEFH
jgi:erythritol kinase